MIEQIKKYIKEIGLVTLFGALIASITWIVNLNRDITELKSSKLDESKTRFLIQLELSDIKTKLRDVENYLLNH